MKHQLYKVIETPTDIFGLKYRPSIAPDHSDESDSNEFHTPLPRHLSEEIGQLLIKYSANAKTIFEIGVHAFEGEGFPTSTKLLIKNKKDETIYIGVDKENRSGICSWAPNVHFIHTHSENKTMIYEKLKELNIDTLDFIFIDGWHSVNQTLSDWGYVEKLSVNGIVTLHDTNRHPGPVVLFDAVDETMFKKIKYATGADDYGLGVFKRIK